MVMFVLVALFTILPEPPITTDNVDVIEYNHLYDEHGRHVFDQLIFYDWNKHECRFDIRAWRLINESEQVPVNNRVIWHDGQVLRRVDAITVHETWTQVAPELYDRSILPKERRRELSTIITRQRAKMLLDYMNSEYR